ncbi:MAG: HNH endonuclease domain-containing protein [Rikenellaceae bacterium]
MEQVLGLDLGTNSIGWAIIEREFSETSLVNYGVHIFSEGVGMDSGIEFSKAAKRTSFRSLRKHYLRRRVRKVETLTVLTELEFCPEIPLSQLKQWRNGGSYPLSDELMEWQRTDDKINKNPYHDRLAAIDRKLNLARVEDRYLLGRAFYHIAQRRGFLSNRLETTKENEDGKVKEAIQALSKEIEENGCRTLGEFFYKCYGDTKIRSRYTERISHYEAEFYAICEKQKLAADTVKRIHRAIFFQRPLKSQKGLVGKCTFEPKKPRCPISHPRFEYYRMLCFVNNIKVKSPVESEFRVLTSEEREAIAPLFLRKSKDSFQFMDIAKKLGYSKNNAYQFNFRLDTSVSGMPFTAQLKALFGDDYKEVLHRSYLDAKSKTEDEVLQDIWHVLFSFDKDENLKDFAVSKLGLSEEDAAQFAKIKLARDYASLSLKAINKIIPYLERGMLYSKAVFLANLGAVVDKDVWQSDKDRIVEAVISLIDNYDAGERLTLQMVIEDYLKDSGCFREGLYNKLYHPSQIETYPDSQTGLLGSPRTGAVRNPMAMRAMFQLRRLINQLLREGKITSETKINIEMVRELNNANMRSAIGAYQRDLNKRHSEYRAEIIRSDVTGITQPTETDVLKYQLWEEQNHKCLYTGREISLSALFGSNPQFDIEHTIPRSVGGDDSQMNKTLACMDFNRRIKREKQPWELANFEEILERLEPLKERIEELMKQMERSRSRRSFSSKEDKDKHIHKRNVLKMELDYLRGKYSRFMDKEGRYSQGFKNSQGVDAGIISKYARLYLKSLFLKVYTVKGVMTAQFRKLWGVQLQDEAKDRSTHIHHCIDAITVACINKWEYDRLSHYYREMERYRWGGEASRPRLEQPWSTFAQDLQGISQEILVSHYTPDNLLKQTKKRKRIRGKVVEGEYLQGDSVRGALHQETYYGAIDRDGEVKYVVRKGLSSLQESDVKKIVDDVVRQKVEQAISEYGFKAAMSEDVPIWMNEAKGVEIKRVRLFTPTITNPLNIRSHRDKSVKDYKQQFHVANDSNYVMAIYEGEDKKGKIKRSFELVNNLDACTKAKYGEPLVQESSKGLPYRCLLKTGVMVLFWDERPDEIWDLSTSELTRRLYKVVGMSSMNVSNSLYGVLTLRYNQEARPSGELKAKNGLYKCGEEYRALIRILHTQFNALVQGYDFELTITGEIKRLR